MAKEKKNDEENEWEEKTKNEREINVERNITEILKYFMHKYIADV